jgi:hypothetical protein
MGKGTDFTTHEVLGRIRATFSQAELAWNDLTTSTDPQRQWNGLKTMVTAGREVTWVLQKLKRREATFNEWYIPIRDEMKTDPLMWYFKGLRNLIEKEGMPKPIYATIDFTDGDNVVGSAEVGIGEDQFGLWVHGATEGAPDPARAKVDAMLSAPGQRLRDIRLPDPPREHLGIALTETSIDRLGRLYLDYLDSRVVTPACEIFGRSGV